MSKSSGWRAAMLRGGLVSTAAAFPGWGTHIASGQQLDVSIPAMEDWVDCGQILTRGEEGSWDHVLWGGFGLTALRVGSTHYLYYQGAKDYDDVLGTVVGRTIGVATSQDGLAFEKHVDNPVLSWSPRRNGEEGAVSVSGFVDDRRRIHLYYGANTWTGGNSVSAGGRVAVSSDGLAFVDEGEVLSPDRGRHWGGGDEVFPLAVLAEGGRRIVYYVPNGTPQSGQLGVAWGGRSLTRSAAVRARGKSVAAWGPSGAARVGPGVYALFVSNVRGSGGPYVEVRTVKVERPDRASVPLATYRFDNMISAHVRLDEELGLWFMYYRSADLVGYGARIATAARDTRERPACRRVRG